MRLLCTAAEPHAYHSTTVAACASQHALAPTALAFSAPASSVAASVSSTATPNAPASAASARCAPAVRRRRKLHA